MWAFTDIYIKTVFNPVQIDRTLPNSHVKQFEILNRLEILLYLFPVYQSYLHVMRQVADGQELLEATTKQINDMNIRASAMRRA